MCRLITLAALITLLAGHADAQTTHFTSCASNTGNNATVAILASGAFVNNLPMQVGDEVAVYTPAGQCVGAAAWTGSNIAITVWGDDGSTAAVDGLQVGQKYLFHVWSSRWNYEYPAPRWTKSFPVHYQSGDSTYKVDGISIIDSFKVFDYVLGVGDESPLSGVALEQNQPNPCVSRARIGFALARASTVSLALYDMAGREVARLVDGQLRSAGAHEVDVAVAGLRNGVYFYRLTTGGKTESRRMTVMR